MNRLPVNHLFAARFLMLGLVACAASIPFVEHHSQFPPLWFSLGTITFASIGVAMATDRWRGLAILALGMAAMVTLLVMGGVDSTEAHIAPGLMLAVAAVAASYNVARAALSKHTHGDARLYHGVSSYILIGMAFALIHQRVNLLMPGSYLVVKGAERPMTGGWADYVWLSFSIMTTSGFAVDVTPCNSISRAVCTAEGVTGVMFPAIFLARMVSAASEEDEKGIS